MDQVGDILREVAPAAEKVRCHPRPGRHELGQGKCANHGTFQVPAVLTYYDVGNSTKGGYDVVEEIRWLGGERICEVHLKDNPYYLGRGVKIDFKAVIDALADIGFNGWAQLETECPEVVKYDIRRNLKFVRRLIASRKGA